MRPEEDGRSPVSLPILGTAHEEHTLETGNVDGTDLFYYSVDGYGFHYIE
jgi:hypothetical protein